MPYHAFYFPWSDVFWIILVIVVLYRPWGYRGRYGRRLYDRHDRIDGAEDILKERFAKGEITEKEYQERMDILKKN